MVHRVVYRCGHAGDIDSDALSEADDFYLKVVQAGLCKECQHDKDYQDAILTSTGRGWFGFKGSEKQQRWAYSIRDRLLHKVNSVAYYLHRGGTPDERLRTQEELACLDKMLRRLGDKSQAAWWIDRRNYAWADFLRETRQEEIAELEAEMRTFALVEDVESGDAQTAELKARMSEVRSYRVYRTNEDAAVCGAAIFEVLYFPFAHIAIIVDNGARFLTPCSSAQEAVHHYLFKAPCVRDLEN